MSHDDSLAAVFYNVFRGKEMAGGNPGREIDFCDGATKCCPSQSMISRSSARRRRMRNADCLVMSSPVRCCAAPPAMARIITHDAVFASRTRGVPLVFRGLRLRTHTGQRKLRSRCISQLKMGPRASWASPSLRMGLAPIRRQHLLSCPQAGTAFTAMPLLSQAPAVSCASSSPVVGLLTA